VVIGVEQQGVLVSDDGGVNFHQANSGFMHREIWGAAPDMARPGRFLVALAAVPDFLLSTDDAGRTWLTMGRNRPRDAERDLRFAGRVVGHARNRRTFALRTNEIGVGAGGIIAASGAAKPARRGATSGLAVGAAPALRAAAVRSGAPLDAYVNIWRSPRTSGTPRR